ncbi:SRPBCC family protein [Antrihabitans stalactiti]|uniref:SRPBCC family protein n=1 Tax=Antrihabitans stalactiti TaxID=2584121 RepID=A0A848KCT2_9NOCA|nr:SRPBCC family protein [Antrihabitans stalactiti]NMN95516.1 SRPBCC family protein [Antrihabitans stalactiti]
MGIMSVLHRQRPAATEVDDATIANASLTFTVRRTFDASVEAVWEAIDDDHAWEWLPFPGVGVRYDSPERGVGVIREMGSVHGIVRALWVERERFWRYEPQERITFGVVSGTWIQYLLVREYAENMEFAPNSSGGTDVKWDVAVTLRLPLRFTKYAPAVWRLAYREVGLGLLMQRRVAAVEALREPPTQTTNGHRPSRLTKASAGERK